MSGTEPVALQRVGSCTGSGLRFPWSRYGCGLRGEIRSCLSFSGGWSRCCARGLRLWSAWIQGVPRYMSYAG